MAVNFLSHSLHVGSFEKVWEMALFGVLSPRNPLIDIKFGMGDYVADAIQYLKISIALGVWPPRAVEMLMVCAFLFVH